MILKTLRKTLFLLLLLFTVTHQVFAQQGRPISDFLDENGQFHNPEGYSGTVDIKGFEMVSGDNGPPVFENVEVSAAPNDYWHALGSGTNARVYSLQISGTDLYVGGSFSSAGGSSASLVARYDMTSGTWHTMGLGVDNNARAFAVSADDLYVGGAFLNAGGNPANYIARYNMTSGTWHTLGSGLNDYVDALLVLGDDLFIGGAFTTAGGIAASRIARYDMNAGTWHALGSGVDNTIKALAVLDNNLYLGGNFTTAGGNPASEIARYEMNTGTWHALGSGVNSEVQAILVLDNNLYVGGNFTTAGGNQANRVARYDTATESWHALGSGVDNTVFALAVLDNNLYVGGNFTTAGGNSAIDVARYDLNAGTWHALGSGLSGSAETFAVSGDDLYVGGKFTSAGGKSANNIARWSPPVTYLVSIPGPNEGWHMIGTPILNVTYASLLNGIWTQGFTGAEYSGGTTNVLWYDESDRTMLWRTPNNASNIVGSGLDSGFSNLGRGFFTYVYADDDFNGTADSWPKELSVTGNSPSLDITKSLTYTNSPSDGYTGWHPLSNPFPFTLDWNEVYADAATTNVTATIQVWDPNRSGGADYLISGSGGDYDGMIAPFQGFWVQATSGSAQVNFSSGHKATSESDYVKQKSEQLLTLQLENGEKSTWTSLVFNDEKSQQPEVFNAVRMSSLSYEFVHMFTADEEGNPLIIQHLPQTGEQSIELPLEVSTTESGAFTLSTKSWSIPSDISLELTDQKTGESFKLSENFDYRFTIEPSNVAKSGVESSTLSINSNLIATKTNLNESRFSLRIRYGSVDEVTNIPTEFSLSQNYPNPFNPSTVIRYQLPVSSEVRLEVFDLTGRQVATLVNGTMQAGSHQVTFNMGDLSSGIYIYRLVAGNKQFNRKLTLIK